MVNYFLSIFFLNSRTKDVRDLVIQRYERTRNMNKDKAYPTKDQAKGPDDLESLK